MIGSVESFAASVEQRLATAAGSGYCCFQRFKQLHHQAMIKEDSRAEEAREQQQATARRYGCMRRCSGGKEEVEGGYSYTLYQ